MCLSSYRIPFEVGQPEYQGPFLRSNKLWNRVNLKIELDSLLSLLWQINLEIWSSLSTNIYLSSKLDKGLVDETDRIWQMLHCDNLLSVLLTFVDMGMAN